MALSTLATQLTALYPQIESYTHTDLFVYGIIFMVSKSTADSPGQVKACWKLITCKKNAEHSKPRSLHYKTVSKISVLC